MKTIILSLSVLTLTIGFIGCGGTATTGNNTNANAKPANAANTATPAPAANTNAAASNTTAEKPAASNEELDFTLVNKTGYDIKELSVGPAGDAEWTKEDEVLKGKTFKDGETLPIKFHPKATGANWDIKVEWADGSKGVEWLKLDLTKIEKITLHYDKATDKTTATTE